MAAAEREILCSCCDNSLDLAAELEYASIAFPLIVSGQSHAISDNFPAVEKTYAIPEYFQAVKKPARYQMIYIL